MNTYFVNVDMTDSEMKAYLREQLQKQFEIQLLWGQLCAYAMVKMERYTQYLET
jgi:hypothetical protein